MFSNKKVWCLIILFLGISVLLTACKNSVQQAIPPKPVLTMLVGNLVSSASTDLVGEVRPRYESAQGFRVAGKIIERRVEVGSLVKKGQLIARLDPVDTNLSAQAANAQIRVEEADFALAQAELERQTQLYAKKFISRSALENQEAKFKSALARLQQSRSQAAVEKNQSRYTSLIAERDGVVTEIRAEPGQVVAVGEQIVKIADFQQMEVMIAVPESRMAGVIAGATAQVKLWIASNRVYNGRIREVAPAADATTRTFQVRVSILNPDATVRLGMTAGVRLPSVEAMSFLVPSAAVTKLNDQATVWVVKPKTMAAGNESQEKHDQTMHKGTEQQVQPRTVNTGAFREDGVQILGGIYDGERIVVAGVHTLVPGQIVQVIDSGIDRASN